MSSEDFKGVWDTLRIQYEGTDSLIESRKINLVRQFEMFISTKGETLSVASEIQLAADEL